jgi:hypothetical protein
LGLGNSELVSFERITRAVFQKPEFFLRVRSEHGKEALLVAHAGQPQQGEGIDFAVRAPVGTNTVGAQKGSLPA